MMRLLLVCLLFITLSTGLLRPQKQNNNKREMDQAAYDSIVVLLGSLDAGSDYAMQSAGVFEKSAFWLSMVQQFGGQ